MSSADDRLAAENAARLNAAYRERNAVVAALLRVAATNVRVTSAPDAFGWLIAYGDLPTGQVSWHFGPDDIDLLDGWAAFVESVDWDGHTTDEKYRRLAALGTGSAVEEEE